MGHSIKKDFRTNTHLAVVRSNLSCYRGKKTILREGNVSAWTAARERGCERGGEEGAEGKGSREIKDPPGIGGSGQGGGGKRAIFWAQIFTTVK